MKSKLKCYYAHTMLSYDSTIEESDIKMLESLGFEVFNPNQESVQKGCVAYSKKHGKGKVMDYFKTIIEELDVLAFRSNPDGTILSGVSYEINIARELGMPVIELPCSLNQRMTDYKYTKQYLTEVGHYKKDK